MTVEFSEQALWETWQFVRFNQKGLSDVCALLQALTKKKSVLYQVDFSEIHPYIFPDKAGLDLEADDLLLHSRSVKYLWEALLETDSTYLPFQLTISPGARLEMLESLWHAERRIEKSFSSYLSGMSRRVKITPTGIMIDDLQGLSEDLSKWDYRKFRPRLETLVSEKAVKENLLAPVEKLLQLMEQGILRNIEECVEEDVMEDVIKHGLPQGVLENVADFLRCNPRATATTFPWSHTHAEFHDMIDELNLCLAYTLAHSTKGKSVYSPILTHSFRVISAGARISGGGQEAIVHHSIAPLYLARIIAAKKTSNLERFFDIGLNLILEIADNLRSHTTTAKLSNITQQARADRFKEARFTKTSSELYNSLKYFIEQYYDFVDPPKLRELLAEEVQEERARDVPNLQVEEFVDLIRRKYEVIHEVRQQAKVVRASLHWSNEGLAALFVPKEGHAHEISDWLDTL